ncbi:hypothetical protein ILUMI_14464, partial [Ignelater luminosus]
FEEFFINELAYFVNKRFLHIKKLAVLNIPNVHSKTFSKHEKNIEEKWEDELYKQMKTAAEEEKAVAISEGNLQDGVPFIPVVDGGWAKRSYGHRYASMAGVAYIIGEKRKTIVYWHKKQILLCMCCQKSENHRCYRNLSESSTATEQQIIIEKHSLRYKFLIGDGDFSVFARILQNVSYGRSN